MAEKKFAGVKGTVENEAVSADFEAAQSFDKIYVGRLGVYYRDGFKTRYIAFEEMERAFLRVQEVRGRMCCGQAFFAYFRADPRLRRPGIRRGDERERTAHARRPRRGGEKRPEGRHRRSAVTPSKDRRRFFVFGFRKENSY